MRRIEWADGARTQFERVYGGDDRPGDRRAVIWALQRGDPTAHPEVRDGSGVRVLRTGDFIPISVWFAVRADGSVLILDVQETR